MAKANKQRRYRGLMAELTDSLRQGPAGAAADDDEPSIESIESLEDLLPETSVQRQDHQQAELDRAMPIYIELGGMRRWRRCTWNGYRVTLLSYDSGELRSVTHAELAQQFRRLTDL